MADNTRPQSRSPRWDNLSQNLLLLCLLLGLHCRFPQTMMILTDSMSLMNPPMRTIVPPRKKHPTLLIHRMMGTSLIPGVYVIPMGPPLIFDVFGRKRGGFNPTLLVFHRFRQDSTPPLSFSTRLDENGVGSTPPCLFSTCFDANRVGSTPPPLVFDVFGHEQGGSSPTLLNSHLFRWENPPCCFSFNSVRVFVPL